MNADLLVYQAKAFYNAYIALDQLSRDDSDTLLLLFAPLVVNGAFSVELALKAILAKNQIEYGKEHNLLILFQMLPKSFQLELWAYLIEKTPEYADSKNRLDELILLSNAFVDWRYALGIQLPFRGLKFERLKGEEFRFLPYMFHQTPTKHGEQYLANQRCFGRWLKSKVHSLEHHVLQINFAKK